MEVTDFRPNSKDCPTLKQLSRIKRNEAAGVSKKWRELGNELLDGYGHKLDTIQLDHQTVDERCDAMFKEWLDVKPDANWNQLIDALNNIGMNTAATNIKKKIAATETKHQPSSYIHAKNLTRDFSILVTNILKLLSTSVTKEQLEDCKRYCIQLKISDTNNTTLFTPQKIEEIKYCSKIEELFEAVKEHWSWDNYEILKDFIELCGDSKEANEEIGKFERKISACKGLNFVTDTLKINPPVGYERFYIYISKRYTKFTLEQYKEIKFYIFQQLATNHNVATDHIKVEFQSLHLEWYVTLQAIPYMIKKANQVKDKLLLRNVISLQIGTRIINCDNKSMKDTSIYTNVPDIAGTLLATTTLPLFSNPKHREIKGDDEEILIGRSLSQTSSGIKEDDEQILLGRSLQMLSESSVTQDSIVTYSNDCHGTNRNVIAEYLDAIENAVLHMTNSQPQYSFVATTLEIFRGSRIRNILLRSHGDSIDMNDAIEVVIDAIGVAMLSVSFNLSNDWQWYPLVATIFYSCIRVRRIRHVIVQGIIWFIRREINQGIWIRGVFAR